MRRRNFIALPGRRGGVAPGRRAQQMERVRRVGVLIAYEEEDLMGKREPARSGRD